MWVSNDLTTEQHQLAEEAQQTHSPQRLLVSCGGWKRSVHSQRSGAKISHVRTKFFTVTKWAVIPADKQPHGRCSCPPPRRKSLFTPSLGCALRWTRRWQTRWQKCSSPSCWRTAYLCTAASCRFVFSQFRLWTLPDRRPPCCWWKWYQILEAFPWLRSATPPLCVFGSSEEAMLRSHLLPRAPPLETGDVTLTTHWK